MPLAFRSAPQRVAPAPPPASGYRTDIEGLRGVAVLLVVLYHAGTPGVSGGFVGVDVFFVLSGYLITGLLVREIEGTGRLSLVEFYARRARRLLPASALMLAVVTVAGMLVFAPVEQERIARTAFATAIYASNLWFLRNSADYFAADVETNPLLHTWSLSVEEQFYFVWPLLILIAFRSRSRRLLVGAMLLVTAVSFGAAAWFTEVRQPLAFFGSPLRAWEFSIGGAAALIPAAFLVRRAAWATVVGWLGLVAVVASGALYSKATVFPGATALLPVLGTTAALLSGVGAPGAGVGRLLNVPALQTMGRLSYGWYLWHWPALVFAAALLPDLSLPTRLAVAFGSLGIAAVTYRWVENPIRHLPALARPPSRSLALAIGLTVISVGASQAWVRVSWWMGSRPAQQLYTTAYQGLPRVYAEGCNPVATVPGVRECVYGDSAAARTVVLFGDSHAAQWFPAVEALALQHRFRVVTLLRSACPAADVTVFNSTLGRDFSECDAWRRDALARIDELRPHTVIVASSMGYLRGIGGDLPHARLSVEEWGAGYRRTLEALDATGSRVMLMRDPPRPNFDVPTCLARAAMPLRRWIGAPSCTPAREAALPPEVFRAERDAARGLRGVSVVDLSEHFCGPEVCAPVRGGVVVFRDTDHLTTAYAEGFAPVLGEWLGFGAT